MGPAHAEHARESSSRDPEVLYLHLLVTGVVPEPIYGTQVSRNQVDVAVTEVQLAETSVRSP